MPSRRSYLATLAAAGLAGCIGESPGTSTDSPTASPTATTAPGTAPRPDVSVEAAAVQYSYRHIEQVDWNGIHSADGQFVFVTVDSREADTTRARSAFTLVADGEQYDPVELGHPYVVTLDVPGNAYEPDDDPEARGWLAFETPAQLGEEPVLRLDRDPAPATWELDVPTATAAPPAWDWQASVPDTVEPESTFDITITAENVGDGPETFRGAVNFSYPMYMPKAFDLPLDPGESGTATVEASIEDADSGTEIEYGVRTPAGESTVAVTVEGESATPTAAPE